MRNKTLVLAGFFLTLCFLLNNVSAISEESSPVCNVVFEIIEHLGISSDQNAKEVPPFPSSFKFKGKFLVESVSSENSTSNEDCKNRYLLGESQIVYLDIEDTHDGIYHQAYYAGRVLEGKMIRKFAQLDNETEARDYFIEHRILDREEVPGFNPKCYLEVNVIEASFVEASSEYPESYQYFVEIKKNTGALGCSSYIPGQKIIVYFDSSFFDYPNSKPLDMHGFDGPFQKKGDRFYYYLEENPDTNGDKDDGEKDDGEKEIIGGNGKEGDDGLGRDIVGCDIGLRKDGKYCDGDKWADQLLPGEVCENSFECNSNVCASGKCVSGSLIEKILNWFSRLFGDS